MLDGDQVYAVDGLFVCDRCVPIANVCECGNFKKEEFEKCYECSQERRDVEFGGHKLEKL